MPFQGILLGVKGITRQYNAFMRNDGRDNDQLRPVNIQRNFTKTPAGSVLWSQGQTVLLCTASITTDLPPWMKPDQPGGWLTAEYVMLPASTPQRKPWPKTGHTDSRGTEIQRLIGRTLRAVVDLSKLGPHTLSIDCQVLQADGGTRTAAICGAYVAMVDAMSRLPAVLPPPRDWPAGKPLPARFDPQYYKPAEVLTAQLAAVSVGVVDGEVRLDLDYHDDSRAQVDMNIALTGKGDFVEVQGSAENGGSFDRSRLNQMMDLAEKGCRELMKIQNNALGR